MSEYIKKEDVLQAIAGLLNVVEQIDGADVVEVIRCKDCKFNKGDNKCLNEHSIIDIPKDDDYCSYGERKDGEE